MTSLLVWQYADPDVSVWAAEAAAYMSIIPVVIPVLQRFYDAFVVPISKAVRDQGCNPVALGPLPFKGTNACSSNGSGGMQASAQICEQFWPQYPT